MWVGGARGRKALVRLLSHPRMYPLHCHTPRAPPLQVLSQENLPETWEVVDKATGDVVYWAGRHGMVPEYMRGDLDTGALILRPKAPVLGAHVLAPCPGDGACPMDGKSMFCHFVQRFTRYQRPPESTSLAPQPRAAPHRTLAVCLCGWHCRHCRHVHGSLVQPLPGAGRVGSCLAG